MTTDAFVIIDKKIYELIHDKIDYDFLTIKEKVEEILKSDDIFFIDNELNAKAVDIYLKNVITQRNNLKKEQEKTKLSRQYNSKETKYTLIEAICKRYEFENKEELIRKVEELENKTNFELNKIYNSI